MTVCLGGSSWKEPIGPGSRTYYLYAGEFVLFEFNPSNGYHQAYGYGANGLVSSWRQNTVRLYAFDPWGNLTNRATPATVLSNTWIDSYGFIVYDDSVGSGGTFPSRDSVAYRGQWGAYTDIENLGLHLRGDYYSAGWGRWLTRQSAGVNEYSGGVNPVASWIDPLQDLLSLLGTADPTGLVDLINAVGYALRGRWAEAAVSAVAIVPVVGDVAKVGTVANKLARGGARLAWRAEKEATGARLAGRTNRWGRPTTLADHFVRHGADFGAKTADEYARMADDFFVRSQQQRLPTKIDPNTGVIRVYDPQTNTFAAYNPDGTVRTFFKPKAGLRYWERQPGGEPWTP